MVGSTPSASFSTVTVTSSVAVLTPSVACTTTLYTLSLFSSAGFSKSGGLSSLKENWPPLSSMAKNLASTPSTDQATVSAPSGSVAR